LGSGSELVLSENLLVILSDRPITELEHLYGERHRRVVESLQRAVKSGFFAAVLGARRVGKTGVVETFTTKTS